MKALTVGLLVLILTSGPAVASQDDPDDHVYLVEGTRQLAREIAGARPERPVEIAFVDQPCGRDILGCAWSSSGIIQVKTGLPPDQTLRVLLHEAAHIFTDDGHGPVWCELFVTSLAQLLPEQWDFVVAQLQWTYDECTPDVRRPA